VRHIATFDAITGHMKQKSDIVNIVDISNFIQATRDAGYKGVLNALAELVDNSLEANAANINISTEAWGTSGFRMLVSDDGNGMAPETLSLALQFGGSAKFGSRTGLGRFGMGLPNASLSQARRVEVFTWQKPGAVWWSHLDIDEILAEKRISLQPPRRFNKQLVNSTQPSGTVVAWSNCDRIQAKNHRSFVARIAHGLGRIYRKHIQMGKNFFICGELIKAVDPLFLMDTGLGIFAHKFGPALSYEIGFGESDNARKTSLVSVEFVELPVEAAHTFSNDEKQSCGISKGAGVSIVRAGREIDFGWFFMGKKRKENYDDWWRCEISFNPVLDDIFGVSNTKQGIRPTELVNSILSPDIEKIAHTLNRRVRNKFTALKDKGERSIAARHATRRDIFLSPPCMKHTVDPVPINVPKTSPTAVTTKYPVRGIRYRVLPRKTEDESFFVPILNSSELLILLNTEHPFYECVYLPFMQSSSKETRQVGRQFELMILAAARAECTLHARGDKEASRRLRQEWSKTLAMFLD
jgi:hypothetical protein